MQSHVLSVVLSLALLLIPGGVFLCAARRLWLSQSRNAFLYWLVGGFAFAGAAGAAQTGLAGVQIDAGGLVVALASLPLWLTVRFATVRTQATYRLTGPIFTSVRRGGGGARRRESAARPGAAM
jgi:hypothetical protein